MSDVEVGIGLSLLQDFTNGVDSDGDDQRDQHGSAAGTPDICRYTASLNCVGHRTDSFGEGTQGNAVEGMGQEAAFPLLTSVIHAILMYQISL